MAKKKKAEAAVEDVWEVARKRLDACAAWPAEAGELKERLTAFIDETRALEARGNVPRGVRRRGERLLEEVSALEARPARSAEASRPSEAEPKTEGSGKVSRRSRSGGGRPSRDAPSGKGFPSKPGRRGGER